MDAKDCSPSCLKIIAKYYEKYYSQQYLRNLCGITPLSVVYCALCSTKAEPYSFLIRYVERMQKTTSNKILIDIFSNRHKRNVQ